MIGQHASSCVSAYESLPRDLDPMVSAAGRSGRRPGAAGHKRRNGPDAHAPAVRCAGGGR